MPVKLHNHISMLIARALKSSQTLSLIACLLVVAGALVPTAAARELSASDLKPQGWVSDFAGVMQPDAIRRLEATLTGLKQATGAEVAVVTVNSVPDGDVKTFAVDLFERWGIGQKGKDNGVLLIASIQDRRAEIEVGYGIEGILPDAKTGRILDKFVIPAFKQGDYGDGLLGGGLAIAQVIAENAGIALQTATRMPSPAGQRFRRASPVGGLFNLVFLLLMIPLFIRYPWLIFLFMGRGGYGGGFGGGFGGGGFGGFGGGMSGGGGAGRSW